MYIFISSLDVGYFFSFHEERKARLLMNNLVPRSVGALFLATSLFQYQRDNGQGVLTLTRAHSDLGTLKAFGLEVLP